MNKIHEIAVSWWRAENPTKKQSELAQKRLAICVECDSHKESIVFGYVCGECGCPIGKKIFTPMNGSCPLKKWDKVEGLS
jgi:ribosomal protein L32